MSELPDPSSAPQEARAEKRDETAAWFDFAQQLTKVGSTAVQLLHAEMRLAISSASRLLVILIFLLPVILLAWLGLTLLVSWVSCYVMASYLDQPALALGVGILFFLLQQLLAIYLMYRLSMRYQQNLSLPATRHHVKQFTEVLRSGIRPVE